MKATTENLRTNFPTGNGCHPTTRSSVLRAIVKIEVAANSLNEAFEADDGRLQPLLAILEAEARTVADRARLVLRQAA